MRKVTTSLAAVGITSAAVFTLGVTPANAATCVSYPPGSVYRADISPPKKFVPRDGKVRIHLFAHRGSTVCPGQRVGFQFAKPGQSFVNYGSVVTGSGGKAEKIITVPVNLTVRWVWRPTPRTVITSAQTKLIAT